jgi:hypothetical protein
MRKIGRNEPCPCGSGKKFKQCHLGKEDEIVFENIGEFTLEMSEKITRLKPVAYGRSREMVDALDIEALTGSPLGVKFIDLHEYQGLDLFGNQTDQGGKGGGVLVNPFKTRKSDPDHLYIAISPDVEDCVLVHELAHVLDDLGGSKLLPGVAKPMAFEMGAPVEHFEHPEEFGYWLEFLHRKFNVPLDADDTIIYYLYQNKMLLKGDEIRANDPFLLKSKSQRILAFLSQRCAEIDALICERPGYIGSRVQKD